MKLFYREFGEGKPLIFIHGLFGMSDNLIPVAEVLSKNFKVYLPDMRNHGNSPNSEIHTYKAMSKDLFDFIEDKNIKKANFIGHSMGGKAVLQFASEHPDRIIKMIIEDISPAEYTPDKNFFKNALNHELLLKKLLKINISDIKTRKELSDILKTNFDNDFLYQMIYKNIRRNRENKKFEYKINVKALLNNLDEMRRQTEINDKMKKLETMFVFGGNSPYFREKDKEFIKLNLPDAKIEIIPEAGHLIHFDKPNKLINTVLSFLLS